MFRGVWWSTNVLLIVAALGLLYTGAREYSVRRYLDGFSDAIVPDSEPAERQVQAILEWMRKGSPRLEVGNPSAWSNRDPETTLNYRQLLSVCGTGTNAFLNLARSNGLSARRLLLLNPERKAKHVVAEVLIDRRWVVADPGYHVLLRDAAGHLLTRTELRDPAIFAQATSGIPNYAKEYSYESVAHVRLARLPMEGFHLRKLLDRVFPNWEEAADWSLLLERESFFALSVDVAMVVFFLLVRIFLSWYADNRLRIRRFSLRAQFHRAGLAFFHVPEIK
jgi:hypothetical protein